MPEGNNKNSRQDIQIVENKKDISYLKKDIFGIKQDISCIKKQVFNEIPHSIQELRNEFTKFQLKNKTWLISILITLVFVLVGLVVNIIR